MEERNDGKDRLVVDLRHDKRIEIDGECRVGETR